MLKLSVDIEISTMCKIVKVYSKLLFMTVLSKKTKQTNKLTMGRLYMWFVEQGHIIMIMFSYILQVFISQMPESIQTFPIWSVSNTNHKVDIY